MKYLSAWGIVRLCYNQGVWNLKSAARFLTVQLLCTRLWCHACFLSTWLRLMPRHLFPWTGKKTLAQALLNCCYSSKTLYFIMPTHIQTWLISGKIEGLLSVNFFWREVVMWDNIKPRVSHNNSYLRAFIGHLCTLCIKYFTKNKN